MKGAVRMFEHIQLAFDHQQKVFSYLAGITSKNSSSNEHLAPRSWRMRNAKLRDQGSEVRILSPRPSQLIDKLYLRAHSQMHHAVQCRQFAANCAHSTFRQLLIAMITMKRIDPTGPSIRKETIGKTRWSENHSWLRHIKRERCGFSYLVLIKRGHATK